MLCSEKNSFVTCIFFAYAIGMFFYAIFCAVVGKSLEEFIGGFMFGTTILLPILLFLAFLLDNTLDGNKSQ